MLNAKLIGGNKLKKKLKEVSKKTAGLTAGFYKDATYPKRGGEIIHVAQVAYWNNFGTTKNGKEFIPPRPFFSNVIEANNKQWSQSFAKGLVNTDYNYDRVFKLLGELIQSDIKKSINETNIPPNAPSTIKQSNNPNKLPLKDTFHMRNSVGYSYNGQSPQYSQKSN